MDLGRHLQVHLIGDLQRVLEDLRVIREKVPNLLRRLEVEAVVVAHPVGVGAVLPQPDAEEDVVGLVVVFLEEVGVVRGHDGEPHLLGQPKDLLVEPLLAFGVVSLDLEVVTVLEDVGVPLRRLPCPLPVVRQKVSVDLAGHTGRTHDEALGVSGQDLPVHPGPHIEPLRVPDGGELDQVPVPLQIPGEKHQMVVGSLSLACPHPFPSVAGSHVGFHPDDGFDPIFPGGFLEGPGPEEAPVVGEGQGRHLEFLSAADQVRDAVRSVQKGVLRVGMKVDEGHGALVGSLG